MSNQTSHVDTCFKPCTLGGLTLKNRFIKAATFENMSPDGMPSQHLLDFHSRFAGGLLADDVIIPSRGTSTMNSMYMFKGDNMLPSMLKYELSKLMRLILRLVGAIMFRSYPYEDLYFLQVALRIKSAVNCKMIYIGGIHCPNINLTIKRQCT